MQTVTSFLSLSVLAGALLSSGCFPMGRYGHGYGSGYGYGGGSYPLSSRQTLTCESRAGQSAYCPTSLRGEVRLDRQLSDAPCREYDTWGTDRAGGGIWVDRGCRAVFSVTG
ncbi:MAG TPA: DUF3011 domain-containing protein [Candidatus Binatia bacterium]|jgi:hypothetical protein|nr:DUF3011 domain-containing protein [Candidatus Binatia bacterium]